MLNSFDGSLFDAIDHVRCLDTGRFKDRRDYVDDVMELIADAAEVIDVTRPRDRHTLPGAAEVRRDLLHPLEWRVERPCPRHRLPSGVSLFSWGRAILDRHPDVAIFLAGLLAEVGFCILVMGLVAMPILLTGTTALALAVAVMQRVEEPILPSML